MEFRDSSGQLIRTRSMPLYTTPQAEGAAHPTRRSQVNIGGMKMTLFKGDKIRHPEHEGTFEITGFTMTHYFAKDKHGVVYRFKRSIVLPCKAVTAVSPDS